VKGRRFPSEEKMAIVLTGLKGEQPMAEICRQYQISRLSIQVPR